MDGMRNFSRPIRFEGDVITPRFLKRLGWAALLALLTCAAPASGDVSIGRADTDGQGLNPAFIDVAGTGNPGDVAVAGDHIYWVAGETIGRANLDGVDVDPDFITGLGSVGGLTADGKYLYWGGASIGRARLDGTAIEPNFMTPSGGADDVAAGRQFIYWTSDLGIGRVNLDGTGADPQFIDTGVTVTSGSPEGVYPPTQLAVNSTRAFWVYSTYHLGDATSDIGRANLDGSGVERVMSSSPVFHGDAYGPLGADDSRVFFRVRSALNEDEIRSFDANSPATGCCSPSWPATDDPNITDAAGGVAVDGGHVYWAHVAEPGLHCSLDTTHRKQRQRGRKVRFAVWFETCEQVSVRASGRAKVAGVHYDLKRTTPTVGPTESSLAVKPSRKDRHEILAALKNGQPANAHLRLRLTDTSDNSSATSYDVRLTRH
jgi:hypothetical protein